MPAVEWPRLLSILALPTTVERGRRGRCAKRKGSECAPHLPDVARRAGALRVAAAQRGGHVHLDERAARALLLVLLVLCRLWRRGGAGRGRIRPHLADGAVRALGRKRLRPTRKRHPRDSSRPAVRSVRVGAPVVDSRRRPILLPSIATHARTRKPPGRAFQLSVSPRHPSLSLSSLSSASVRKHRTRAAGQTHLTDGDQVAERGVDLHA